MPLWGQKLYPGFESLSFRTPNSDLRVSNPSSQSARRQPSSRRQHVAAVYEWTVVRSSGAP